MCRDVLLKVDKVGMCSSLFHEPDSTKSTISLKPITIIVPSSFAACFCLNKYDLTRDKSVANRYYKLNSWLMGVMRYKMRIRNRAMLKSRDTS